MQGRIKQSPLCRVKDRDCQAVRIVHISTQLSVVRTAIQLDAMLTLVVATFIAGLALGILSAVLVNVIWSARTRAHGDEEQPLLRPDSQHDTVINDGNDLLRPELPSENSSSSTIYTLVQDLDYKKLEVRILRLHAGAPGSKLEASLKVESLGPDTSVTPYEALSYVWAEISGETDIFVDGIQHKITANLGRALTPAPVR
jgi:hypothetical protein